MQGGLPHGGGEDREEEEDREEVAGRRQRRMRTGARRRKRGARRRRGMIPVVGTTLATPGFGAGNEGEGMRNNAEARKRSLE